MKLIAAALLLLLSACATLSSGMSVRAEPISYSPAMSSTVGIGLTTVFVPPAGTTVNYHWNTDFGYFVSWHAPDFKISGLGPDLVATEGTLYWTYDPRLTPDQKPAVTITIEAQDAESGRVLARSKIKLDWDRDTARVRD
jgi:hypothetical protein